VAIETITHFHFCCGLGAGAKGFNQANPRVGNLEGKFECLGGIDVAPSAIRDFKTLTGVDGTLMDLFTRDQYTRFHGKEPSKEWKEATPVDIRNAAKNQTPNVVFISSPCKGASGLLSQTKAATPKYQALNELTLRCVWLMIEAWKDDPVDLIVFENVPRLATRGRHLLDQISQLLSLAGYAVSETTHDCGEIGGLAQSRKRFLLVARHIEKVPPFLYQPTYKGLRSVGSVLDRMPLPGDKRGGVMHRVPRLQWKTWVRLAFVEAGKDWRSLERLAMENGHLRDYVIMPEHRNGYMGVNDWNESMGTVAGKSKPTNGNFSVADPRGNGFASKYAVTHFDRSSGTVIAGSTTGQGAFAVADPRPGMKRQKGDSYYGRGHYGVIPWDGSCGAVSAAASHDNGRWSVADPRLPNATEKCLAVIRSIDGTWHRPFTTLELAALQSLIEPEEYLELDGLNDEAWRERIGNAVPPSAAKAIAEVMGTTILLARSGETFLLSNASVWVKPMAIALSIGGIQ
jgi:site-specific DNA-cytosine methylase